MEPDYLKSERGTFMEYGMIPFPADKTDIVEDILLELARFTPPPSSIGYPVDVSDSLRAGLSFMEDPDGVNGLLTGPLLPLTRVYVSMKDGEGNILVAADSMAERIRWISSRGGAIARKHFSGGVLKYCPVKDWSLVGITAPGWMLLFDEDSLTAEQDALDSDIHVAYLPAGESIINFLSPDRSTAETLSLLTEYLLSCLPFREGEE